MRHDIHRDSSDKTHWCDRVVAAAQIAQPGDEFAATTESDADFAQGVVYALRGHLDTSFHWEEGCQWSVAEAQ